MICLVGFMGAGKTSALAEMESEGLETLDLDASIEAEAGRSIPSIFEEDGEAAFRELEQSAALAAISVDGPDVVALGGGAVLSGPVREALSSPSVTTVWLDSARETAWRRAAGSSRPLAADRESFDHLFEQRRTLYSEVADVLLIEPDRGTLARALPTIHSLAALPEGTRAIWARGATGEHPIYVGQDLLRSPVFDPGTGPLPSVGKTYLLTDDVVGPIHGESIRGSDGEVVIPAGEESKTLATAENAMRGLARLGVTRDDRLVVLGGGVVGDLGGFCASTYQRGIGLIQVPTTLVAQVDSAYGGKTGVDLPEGKNYVGTFRLPDGVVTDTATLSTLPPEEVSAGMAEVIKTALLAGGALWNSVLSLEPGEIVKRPDVIFECAAHKCRVVAADELDSGLRATLNLGHTVGHAIETATDYGRYRHGEAVALGLLAALRLSEASELRDQVGDLLVRHDLPTVLDPAVSPELVAEVVSFDKKRTEKGVGFVLLPEPGAPRTGCLITADRVTEAVEELTK